MSKIEETENSICQQNVDENIVKNIKNNNSSIKDNNSTIKDKIDITTKNLQYPNEFMSKKQAFQLLNYYRFKFLS